MDPRRESLFGMAQSIEGCCCDQCDANHASFCPMFEEKMDQHGSLQQGLEHGYSAEYGVDFAENYSQLMGSEYEFGELQELEGTYEDEYGSYAGSYASVTGKLSHVGSQLEFEDFETIGSVGRLSCDGEIEVEQRASMEEMEERLSSEMLDSLACMGCGSMGCSCGLCLPAVGADIADSGSLSTPRMANPWARRGPLARFRLGPWFRRRAGEVEGEMQHGLGAGERLKPRRGMLLGRLNPWGRHSGLGAELELSAEDEKLAGRCGWGMGLGRLPLPRRRVRVVQERPRKRHFFLILGALLVPFCALFWRELGLRRMVLTAMRLEAEEQLCRRSNLSAGPWRYCGPHNGHDFSGVPYDTMDAICAQHDYCIEKAEYVVDGRPRKLYPMGEQDEDDFLRCGIPMRSHTDPNFGCQINACDTEMFNSLHVGFACSSDPAMPKSPWCDEERFVGREVCSEYGLSLQFFACKAVARMSKAYHGWKIRSTCSFISQHMMEMLQEAEAEEEEDGDSPDAAEAEPQQSLHLDLSGRKRGRWSLVTRILGSVWATLRRVRPGMGAGMGAGAGATSDSDSPLREVPPWLARPGGWNCTCQAPDPVRFRPPREVEEALKRMEASLPS